MKKIFDKKIQLGIYFVIAATLLILGILKVLPHSWYNLIWGIGLLIAGLNIVFTPDKEKTFAATGVVLLFLGLCGIAFYGFDFINSLSFIKKLLIAIAASIILTAIILMIKQLTQKEEK